MQPACAHSSRPFQTCQRCPGSPRILPLPTRGSNGFANAGQEQADYEIGGKVAKGGDRDGLTPDAQREDFADHQPGQGPKAQLQVAMNLVRGVDDDGLVHLEIAIVV